jgi:poly(3-hydroxybutyrate) depolymerase
MRVATGARTLVWIALIGACLLATPWAQAKRVSWRFEIDGQVRKVLLFVPDQPGAEPPPLLVAYHGRGDDAAAFAQAVQLHRDWPEAIVAYPRGESLQTPPMRGWQYRKGQFEDRDLKLTEQLLARIAERYGTRAERSYAAGFSNGGHFLFLLLKEQPRWFAAYAILGAVQPQYVSEAEPRPLMYLFGRGEPREFQDDWASTVQALIRHNRSEQRLTDVPPCCKRAAPQPGGAPLVFGTYNAGHIWPAGGNDWLIAFFQQPQ